MTATGGPTGDPAGPDAGKGAEPPPPFPPLPPVPAEGLPPPPYGTPLPPAGAPPAGRVPVPPGYGPPPGSGGNGEPPADYLPPGYGPPPGAPPPGGPQAGPGRRGINPAWIVAAVVAVVVVLVRTHHVSRFTVIEFAALVVSIIVHEVSHGVVALWFGDDTAKRAGRLTLNPVPHIDPIGTVVLPVLLTLAGGPAFGWAKPVPVNLSKLRRPRNESVVVGLAGPFVNVVLAVACGVGLGVVLSPTDKTLLAAGFLPSSFWIEALFALGTVNVILAVFNLIPIPPLDGSSVVERFIPRAWLPTYLRIRPYTLILPLVFVVFFPSALNAIFNPALRWWSHLFGMSISSF